MMNINYQRQQQQLVMSRSKKTTYSFESMQSPSANSLSPSKHSTTRTSQSRRWCGVLNDCMSMGSIISTNQSHHHQTISTLVQQVSIYIIIWCTTCMQLILNSQSTHISRCKIKKDVKFTKYLLNLSCISQVI